MSARILILEHDPIIATDLYIAVEDFGYQPVGPAVTTQEGLDMVRGEPLGAALLDCHMMGDTSRAVAQLLAERGTPFAYVTGAEDPGAAVRGWPDAPVLAKPLSHRDLERTIAHLLG